MSSTIDKKKSLDGSVQLLEHADGEGRGDDRKEEDHDDGDDEFDYSEYEQSLTGTEYYYHDHDDDTYESEDDRTTDSEDQTIESRCLVAIGVPDDDGDDSGSSKEPNHASEKPKQQDHQHQPPVRDISKQRPPPILNTASDERVATIIAREEYNAKMRIKEERAVPGRLRPKPSRSMTANASVTANANALVTATTTTTAAGTSSATGAVVSLEQQPQTRADRERQEKMRTFEARQGGAVRKTLRRAFTRTRPARSSATAGGRLDSKQNETETVEMAKKKPPPPIDVSSDDAYGAAFSPSSARSQRSISSGIDLDDKTRQRILSRSNLRRGQPRRPLNTNSSSLGSDRNRNNASTTTATETATATATSLSASTGRRRPSDDKRNLRISPRMTASSLITGSTRSNINSAQLPSPAPAPASRPSDEKAAFRRRRNPRRATRAIAVEPAVAVSFIAQNRNETVRGSGTGSSGSDLGVEVALESNNAYMANTIDHDGDDDHNDHSGLEVTIVEDEEPEILPGAFAVSGIGDDEEGQGVSGYDSGFEDDVDDSNLMEQTMHSNNTNAEEETEGGEDSQHQQRPPLLDGDLEAAVETTSSAVDATSQAVVTSNPFVAELYEVEAAVTAVTAKILVAEEEDPTTQGKIRKLSVQMSCGLLAMLVVAAVIIGVVVPKVVGNKNDGIDGSIEPSAPVIEGWKPIGGVLTVEEFFKDNIRFGNSVSISADGNRVAVGLPGADNPADDSLKSTGGVQIFDLVNGTEWENTKFKVFGEYSNAALGTNVALSDDGTRVAIGAPSYSSDETGYVSIYEESNVTGVWALAGNFSSGSNTTLGGVFGDAVGFSGDGRIIAIGDKKFDSFGLEDTGVVEIYQEINGTWNQMGTSLLGSKKRDQFGWSVALSKDGKRVAASSLGDTKEPGSVKIFVFNGTAWEGIGSSLVGESIREAFGFSVELSGDGSIVAASATGYSRDGQEASVGIVRSYRFDGELEEWTLYGQPLEGENEFDAFGSSIALSHDGNTIAIGGPKNRYFCDDCGHVKVFRNMGGGTWNSSGSALGKSGIDSGEFGYDVALSATGNRLVGAAPFTTFNGFVSKVGQVLVFDSIAEDAADGS